VAVNDTGSATEKGGTHNGSGGSKATGNVLTNDTDVDHFTTLTVAAVNGSAANLATAVTGTYGSLTLGSDGTWSYALNNADVDTNALAQGATATETFQYTVTDEHGATSTANLVITITGTNDAPVLDAGKTPVLDAENEGAGAPVGTKIVSSTGSADDGISVGYGAHDVTIETGVVARQADGAVIVNMAENRVKGRKVFDQFAMACNEYLGFKPRFAGVVCRDPRVPDSIRAQTPLPIRHPQSQAYEDVIRIVEIDECEVADLRVDDEIEKDEADGNPEQTAKCRLLTARRFHAPPSRRISTRAASGWFHRSSRAPVGRRAHRCSPSLRRQ
jgi:VCBS repeat-containing protein